MNLLPLQKYSIVVRLAYVESFLAFLALYWPHMRLPYFGDGLTGTICIHFFPCISIWHIFQQSTLM